GLFENSNIPHYDSIFEASSLGFVSKGDWNQIDNFLILPKNTAIKFETAPQKKGGIKYSVSQFGNEDSVVIKFGGVYKEGILVAGRAGTISHGDFSLKLFKEPSSKIRKDFIKVGSFYVGKNALQKLKSGWRLVTMEGSPKEYDLK